MSERVRRPLRALAPRAARPDRRAARRPPAELAARRRAERTRARATRCRRSAPGSARSRGLRRIKAPLPSSVAQRVRRARPRVSWVGDGRAARALPLRDRAPPSLRIGALGRLAVGRPAVASRARRRGAAVGPGGAAALAGRGARARRPDRRDRRRRRGRTASRRRMDRRGARRRRRGSAIVDPRRTRGRESRAGWRRATRSGSRPTSTRDGWPASHGQRALARPPIGRPVAAAEPRARAAARRAARRRGASPRRTCSRASRGGLGFVDPPGPRKLPRRRCRW